MALDDAPSVKVGSALLARSDVERLMGAIIRLIAVGATLGGLVGLRIGDRYALIASLTTLAIAPYLAFLVRRGRLNRAARIWTWLLLGIAVFVTVTGKGTRDVGMNVFPVAIISAAMLLRRREATVMVILTVVAGGMIGVAEIAGWLTHPLARETTPDKVADILILLGAVGGLVILLSKTLYRSLERAYRTERSYAQIFEAAHDAILVADPATRVVDDVNAAAVAIFNRPREELVGAALETVLGARDQGGHDIVEHVQAAAPPNLRRFDVHLGRADGAPLDVEVSVQRALIADRDRLLIVARDITERRAIEKTLRESENLRVVGQLARGVAHDFNNQLTGILGSAALLERPLAEIPGAAGHLEVIKRSAQRSAELVRQLLAFARKSKQQNAAVDCNRLIDEVEELLRRSLDKRIEIQVRKGAGALMTFGDGTLLQNALLNLALNARDAMPSGGVLTLASELVTVDAALRARLPDDVPEGRYVALVVGDTGTGMDARTLAHIFEPFFTTKETGNGMGLAAVYGTIRSHGGVTRVESEPGRGTRFELMLPLVEGARARADAPVVDAARERPKLDLTGRRVLLVDDERLVRETTAALLKHFGAIVDPVDSGAAALERFRGGTARYDAVVMDLDMPGLSGVDTTRELRRYDEAVPVLIASGHGAEVAHGRGELVQGLIGKPYSPEQLATAVATVMAMRR